MCDKHTCLPISTAAPRTTMRRAWIDASPDLRRRRVLLQAAQDRVGVALARLGQSSAAADRAAAIRGAGGGARAAHRAVNEVATQPVGWAGVGGGPAPPPQLVSNGYPRPSLFHAAPAEAGVGMKDRRDRFTAPVDEILRHHGVRELNDHARAALLEELADCVPPEDLALPPSPSTPRGRFDAWLGGEPRAARARFDAMLARVQHAHLVAAVQNELRAGATAEADPLWRTDNRGFYEADEEGPPPHIAPGAYAAYLQAVRA